VASSNGFWKENWAETQQHFTDWWRHQGLVVALWGGAPPVPPRDPIPDPGPAPNITERYCNASWRAQGNLYRLARTSFPLDTLPLAGVDLGPGSLCLALGSEPEFTDATVWYHPCIKDPEAAPKLRFDPKNKWWRLHEGLLEESVKLSRGRYLVGCPDLIENIDILVSLRGMEPVLTDMLDCPEWIERMVAEINQMFFKAYDRVYKIIQQPDGSAAFSAFHLWAPGKIAKVQCDASAAFGPSHFKRFVVPALTAQCEWLDYSMYHLDGTQAMCHLDLLLGIEPLDAIEWTPQHGIPGGGSPQWYDLYRRIIKGGKSVQAVGVAAGEVGPLLDAVGPKGMYIGAHCQNPGELETLAKQVEKYR
jgi:hypothetical protein